MSQSLKDISQHLTDTLQNQDNKVSYLSNSVLSQCLQVLSHESIPDSKSEAYKYCPLNQVLRKPVLELKQGFKEHVAEAVQITSDLVLYWNNGRIEIPERIPQGLSIFKFSDQKSINLDFTSEPTFLEALNVTFPQDSLQIDVLADAPPKLRIFIKYSQHCNSSSWINIRLHVTISQGKQVECIEEFSETQGANCTLNFFARYTLKQNASLNHLIVQESGSKSIQLQDRRVILDSHSNYTGFTCSARTSLARFDHTIEFNGDLAQGTLRGLSLVHSNELTDHHTKMIHRVPNTQSHQIYKSLVWNKANSVFNGIIHVLPQAQKTDAYQSSKNMLIGDDAQCNVKPQLEIFANDVKCSHGTSTGHVDPQALFYLQSRGIGKSEATRLLQDAFAAELIETVSADDIRTWLQEKLQGSWLQ